jgi:hypothetical protein
MVAMYSEIMRDNTTTTYHTDKAYDALFNTVTHDSPGTLTPWAYFGNSGTYFPLHIEDGMMASANILVAGSPKMWITVPFPYLSALLQMLSRMYPRSRTYPPPHVLSPPAWAQSCLLVHRQMFVHPQFLTRHGIPFTVARQAPGDLIIADARGAHQGWNTGRNLASAVNFLDERTIRLIVSHARGACPPRLYVVSQPTRGVRSNQ